MTEGVFLPDGTFLPLPKLACPPKPWRRWAIEPFLKLWEQEVFALLLAEGRITEEVVANMRIISFLDRRQTEVIEKLRCAKRTSILGKLTGRAWEAHSSAPWALGGGCPPGPTAAGGSGRGLTEQEPKEETGDCTQHLARLMGLRVVEEG